MPLRRPLSFPSLAPYLLVAFFIIKAVMTGVWVVRPWDVPDEVGHFSYIKDLACGKGMPVLHETEIDKEVWADFARLTNSAPGSNWIAQHPPLYHILMVPVYWIGSLFGTSFWGSFYLIRIVTAFAFGLGIFTLIKAFREAELPKGAALGLGLMIACIPNHTYLAAAVNHDGFVFLFGSLVLLYWIRLSRTKSESDLIRLGVFLGLGGLIKYTFLVLFPPIICLVCLTLWMDQERVFKRLGTFLSVALIPITFWMLRNHLLLGEVLPIDSTGFESDQALELGFLEFGRSFPVFTILMRTYWGLLGWLGDGSLEVRWLQIYSIYQQAFTWPLTLLLFLTQTYLIKEALKNRQRLYFGIVGLIGFLVIFMASGWLKNEQGHYLPLFYIGISVVGWRLAEAGYFISAGILNRTRTVELGALGVFIFFLSVHFYKIFAYSVSSGALEGTFGRYYLPVVGFFIVGFIANGLRRFPLGGQMVMVFAMIYSSVELYVWLHEAIPFFYVHG